MRHIFAIFILLIFAAQANQKRLLNNSTTLLNTEELIEEDDFKISLSKEISYTTVVSEDKKETFTGLNLFKQDTDTVPFELRFDYSNLLFPGEKSKVPVTCVKTDGCEKSATATTLDYFGLKITNAFPTKTYLNIGSPD
jgi:hypothetical protein